MVAEVWEVALHLLELCKCDVVLCNSIAFEVMSALQDRKVLPEALIGKIWLCGIVQGALRFVRV
jgi:hypothetical protein